MKITVFGAGHVGLPTAVFLSRSHKVFVIDTDSEKVSQINNGVAFQSFLEQICEPICLNASVRAYDCKNSDFVVISTPTDYDPQTEHFDTKSIEDSLDAIRNYAPGSLVVIRSTVPIGYTKHIAELYSELKIIYSPEFMRECYALFDCAHPSRIVLGVTENVSDRDVLKIESLLIGDKADLKCPVFVMSSTEAETVKLFSNTYLAMRVAFFNELDTFAEIRGLDTKHLISGISSDPRIGDYYNNPSFGYGGYCLPKDVKQLMSDYAGFEHPVISSIEKSNTVRKRFIAKRISEMVGEGKTVGIYRLTVECAADNCRGSPMRDIIRELCSYDLKIILYEPVFKSEMPEIPYAEDLQEFFDRSDIILANRYHPDLQGRSEVVYCRDLGSDFV